MSQSRVSVSVIIIMHFDREEFVASIVGHHTETTEKSHVCASESKSTANRAMKKS